MKINRRSFVKNATLASLGTASITAGAVNPAELNQQQRKKSPAPDSGRIRMGFIGVGNRGGSHRHCSSRRGLASV